MSKTHARRKSRRRKQPVAGSGGIAQEALQVTWALKGHLKNVQIAYLRVGALLAKVRDQRLYAALHHPDLESYAAQRLQLGRTSLYRYLQVYDWVAQTHPEWLQPRPKGFIPDLADVADMMWIERELAKPDVAPRKRADLTDLLQKARAGRLRERDLSRYRRRGRQPAADSLRAFLSKLRTLRMRGSQLAAMPPEVISELDAAIQILSHAVTLQQARLGPETGEFANMA